MSREFFRGRMHLSAYKIVVFSFLAFSLGVSQLAAQAERVLPSFAELTKKVEPAVVSIDAKSKVSDIATKGNTPSSTDQDDIMEFFRRQLPARPVYAIGSGFIVDPSGYIVTNEHVIEQAARITVKLDNGEEYVASVIGTDDETDLAVLKIDAGKPLPFLKFGDSERAQVGDWVLAIGSPFGLTKTVTAGIISQTRRETPYASPFQKFIQTDAAINQGNSGGPLVNMDGEVIGVNSQIATTTGDYNGIGFALPSAVTSDVYQQIVKDRRVRRGYLGAHLDSVKAEYAKVYGLSEAKGAIVIDVRDKQSPAGVAGLQPGDVITTYNGKPVENALDLIMKVSATTPDDTVNIEYLRENGSSMEKRTAALKLQERPTNGHTADVENGGRKLPIEGTPDAKPFGLTLVELTPDLATSAKLEGQKGLLVKEVNPTSFIADVRMATGEPALNEGDLIQRINRVAVTNQKAFSDVVAKLKPGDPVVLYVVFYNPRSKGPELKIVQFTVN